MLVAELASDAMLDAACDGLCRRRREYPDKIFIGRIEKGFDFLDFQFSRDGLTVSDLTFRMDRFELGTSGQGAVDHRVGREAEEKHSG